MGGRREGLHLSTEYRWVIIDFMLGNTIIAPYSRLHAHLARIVNRAPPVSLRHFRIFWTA